jgi:hypothetical protein
MVGTPGVEYSEFMPADSTRASNCERYSEAQQRLKTRILRAGGDMQQAMRGLTLAQRFPNFYTSNPL